MYKLRIVQDTDADNPREWDNFSHMTCWHRNYSLGDTHNFETVSDFMSYLLEETYGDTERAYNKLAKLSLEYAGNFKARDAEILEIVSRKFIILPLYLYDHSGISIATKMHGYHGSWDCGIVGWIYVSKDEARKEFNWKNLTAKRINDVKEALIAEVELYNAYISGNCFGYELVQLDEYGDETDSIYSCWGFYGNVSDNIDAIKGELEEKFHYLLDELMN